MDTTQNLNVPALNFPRVANARRVRPNFVTSLMRGSKSVHHFAKWAQRATIAGIVFTCRHPSHHTATSTTMLSLDTAHSREQIKGTLIEGNLMKVDWKNQAIRLKRFLKEEEKRKGQRDQRNQKGQRGQRARRKRSKKESLLSHHHLVRHHHRLLRHHHHLAQSVLAGEDHPKEKRKKRTRKIRGQNQLERHYLNTQPTYGQHMPSLPLTDHQ